MRDEKSNKMRKNLSKEVLPFAKTGKPLRLHPCRALSC